MITPEQIKERITRNEDAIDKLKFANHPDYWARLSLILYHENRILRWEERLE